jgi:hypothetical protein
MLDAVFPQGVEDVLADVDAEWTDPGSDGGVVDADGRAGSLVEVALLKDEANGITPDLLAVSGSLGDDEALKDSVPDEPCVRASLATTRQLLISPFGLRSNGDGPPLRGGPSP